MSFLRYAREHVIELALFIAMAAALAFTLDECFFIDSSELRNTVLTMATVVVLSASLFASAYSRRTVVIGIPAVLAAVVVSYFVLSQFTSTQLFEDSYDNTVFAFHVAWTTTLFLFLCTRRAPLLTTAYVIGAFLCSTVQFLYSANHIAEALVFLTSGAVLVMMMRHVSKRRKANAGIISTQTSGLLTAAGLAVSGIVVAAAALLAALAVFFVVVAPLNPPAAELKLITEHYALEEVRVTGLSDIIHMINQDKNSKNTEDDSEKSSNPDGTGNDSDEKGTPDEDGDNDLFGAGIQALGDALMYAIKYFAENWLYILIGSILAIVILLALVIALRRMMRNRTLSKLKDKGPREEAMGLYKYLSSGLTLCGICNRGSNTPIEMASKARTQTDQFEGGDMPLSFEELTETFAKTAYGDYTPDEDESTRLREYAKAFPKHVMRFVGRRKYLRLFFKV